jgi:hypothetical protein
MWCASGMRCGGFYVVEWRATDLCFTAEPMHKETLASMREGRENARLCVPAAPCRSSPSEICGGLPSVRTLGRRSTARAIASRALLLSCGNWRTGFIWSPPHNDQRAGGDAGVQGEAHHFRQSGTRGNSKPRLERVVVAGSEANLLISVSCRHIAA